MRSLFLLGVLAGCPAGSDAPAGDTDRGDTDAGDTDAGDTDGTFAPVQALFTRSCTTSGCHAGPAPQQGLDLTDGHARDGLVGIASVEVPAVSRVAPGDLDGSWLWHKVNGTMSDVDPQDVTDAMPPPFGLGGNDVEVLRAWIEAGAPAR